MVRIYIYLRDANSKSFYSEKLQEKRNKEVLEDISSLKALGGGGASTVCSKCGMPAHSGGTKQCPLRHLSDADGRKRMKFVMEQLGKMSKQDWARVLAPAEE
jgi:hypothetical protein